MKNTANRDIHSRAQMKKKMEFKLQSDPCPTQWTTRGIEEREITLTHLLGDDSTVPLPLTWQASVMKHDFNRDWGRSWILLRSELKKAEAIKRKSGAVASEKTWKIQHPVAQRLWLNWNLWDDWQQTFTLFFVFGFFVPTRTWRGSSFLLSVICVLVPWKLALGIPALCVWIHFSWCGNRFAESCFKLELFFCCLHAVEDQALCS